MAQTTIEVPVSRLRTRRGRRRWFPILARRLAERREIRRWMRRNPPSLGRESGARC